MAKTKYTPIIHVIEDMAHRCIVCDNSMRVFVFNMTHKVPYKIHTHYLLTFALCKWYEYGILSTNLESSQIFKTNLFCILQHILMRISYSSESMC